MKKRTKVWKYVGASALALGLCITVFFFRGGVISHTNEMNLVALADGWTVSGLTILTLYLLIESGTHGSLRMLGFSIRQVFFSFRRDGYKYSLHYKSDKSCTVSHGASPLGVVGAISLVCALLCILGG